MTDAPILIWGAGAIGGVLGAYWARAGLPVLMVDIVEDHAKACSNEGLLIEGPVGTFRQIVPCVTPDQLEGQFDRVILAVKSLATETALTAMNPHLSDKAFVVSAQNGLNERTIARHLGAERTVGAFVNFGSDWIEPGRILFGNRGAVVIGELDGPPRARTEDLFKAFKIFEPDAVLTDNIWGYLWGKLGYLSMLYATALTEDSMSANFADPTRGLALTRVAEEVMTTAQAEGVDALGFNGFEPAAFAPGHSEEAALKSLAALAAFNAKTAKTHSGIYRDLAVRKRKTEVEPQMGIVTEIARGHGIKTPALDRLIDLIHDIEDGRRPLSAATFDELTKVASSS